MPADRQALTIDEPLPDDVFQPQALGRLGETLTTQPTHEQRELRLDELDAGSLEALLAERADNLPDGYEHLAAALWANRTTTVLLPGFLAAWTLADVGLDASPANLALHLDGPKAVACRILDPSRAAQGRPEREQTIETLFAATLDPFVDRLADAGVPRRVAWTNVGNLVAYLFDRLAAFDLAGATTTQDRARLLDADRAAWDETDNPLQGTVAYEPLPGPGPAEYQVRDVCCLKQALPAKQPCASCPRVDAQRRAELLADRRRTL